MFLYGGCKIVKPPTEQLDDLTALQSIIDTALFELQVLAKAMAWAWLLGTRDGRGCVLRDRERPMVRKALATQSGALAIRSAAELGVSS